jgi:parvulin-like peptidyl-prolyl isomerase
MMSKRRAFILIAVACTTGVMCSELLCRWPAFRDCAGRFFGRGRLIAVSGGIGLYEKDLQIEEVFSASDLLAAENLRNVARNQQTDATKVDRELSLVHAQFGSDKAFARALASNDLSLSSLREKIAAELRSLEWIEKQIRAGTKATESDWRNFYQGHLGLFSQPVRFRASHIFLAAPAETPPEVLEAKEKAIEALAVRLSRGEVFSTLAAEASEDEATKSRGGDLGFFSSARMPPDFFAEIEKLRAGQTSKPFRSHLGFHLVLVTEIKPARALGFEETRDEVPLALSNERRALIAEGLAETLGRAEYVRAE